jgi:hypothetical protein
MAIVSPARPLAPITSRLVAGGKLGNCCVAGQVMLSADEYELMGELA